MKNKGWTYEGLAKYLRGAEEYEHVFRSSMVQGTRSSTWRTSTSQDDNEAKLGETVTKLIQHNVKINTNLDRIDKNEANLESNIETLGELEANISENSGTLNKNKAKIESLEEKLKLLRCTSGYVKGEHGECLGK